MQRLVNFAHKCGATGWGPRAQKARYLELISNERDVCLLFVALFFPVLVCYLTTR